MSFPSGTVAGSVFPILFRELEGIGPVSAGQRLRFKPDVTVDEDGLTGVT